MNLLPAPVPACAQHGPMRLRGYEPQIGTWYDCPRRCWSSVLLMAPELAAWYAMGQP